VTVLAPKSAVEGVSWPGLPDAGGAIILSLMFQLGQSQWWPPEALLESQFRQLGLVLRHAARWVPHYRESFAAQGFDPAAPLTAARWAELPVLTRPKLQGSFEGLSAERVPREHGRTAQIFTSGSTATPVRVLSTALSNLFWRAVTLRDHLWQQRNLSGKLAVIRVTKSNDAPYPHGLEADSWGRSSAAAYRTGPAARLDITASIQEQVEWLQRQDPDYLLSLPSNLMALAEYCRQQGIKLARLKQVLSIAELLFPEARAACGEAWGVPVTEAYSAQEVGYIALQCAKSELLHVQAEDMLVEVLDDDGRPCEPGEVGRVVVTPLHNFAMPLVRYEVGDLAEVAERCPCGRGLPALSRVLGRTRDRVTLPDGRLLVPFFPGILGGFAHLKQFQVVRRAPQRLEMKLVAERELTEAEAAELRRRVRERIRYPFEVAFTYHDEIPRGTGGKFDYFRSEVD
jgi:phenylacetate-CoA ligase